MRRAALPAQAQVAAWEDAARARAVQARPGFAAGPSCSESFESFFVFLMFSLQC